LEKHTLPRTTKSTMARASLPGEICLEEGSIDGSEMNGCEAGAGVFIRLISLQALSD
jgi:hypothetical protein